jgi:hypothetical protein
MRACTDRDGSARRRHNGNFSALAEIGGDGAAPVAAIARRMGKARTSDLSVARNEVIIKGLVYAPDRGLLAFTIPGMHRFVMRQH